MTETTTILQVRNSVAFGGVETTMLGWLGHIDRSRFRCPVALFRNRDGCEEAFGGPLIRQGEEIFALPWWPGRQFSQAVDRLVELIGSTGASMLHTHDWRSDVAGYYAARRTGIPILTTVYVWFGRPLKTWLSERIDAWYIRRFHLVTAVCEATRQQCIDRGVPRSKTRVLISGISARRCRLEIDRGAVRERFGISEDDIAFVYVARLYPEKAHLCLVDALAEARKQCGPIKLLLLGTGPLQQRIRQRARRLGLQDVVLLPGFVQDVPAVLPAMDAMVHASLAEGIPLAVYEGMLAGLPVVGSAVDATAEVVVPGRTGWLVPPGDAPALAAKLVEAARDVDGRRTFGRAAREMILTDYNIDIARRKLERTYEDLLARAGGEKRAQQEAVS